MASIFLLGAYRSFHETDRDLSLLMGLRSALRAAGHDAFLAIDDRAAEILEESEPEPLEKTRRLAELVDASFFVMTGTGRLPGVVAELTTLQIEAPERADRRVVFVEETYPMSAILDPSRDGILSTPPVRIVPFEGPNQLVGRARRYAELVDLYGKIA